MTYEYGKSWRYFSIEILGVADRNDTLPWFVFYAVQCLISFLCMSALTPTIIHSAVSSVQVSWRSVVLRFERRLIQPSSEFFCDLAHLIHC